MWALTNPDENGNVLLLQMLSFPEGPHVVGSIQMHESDLPSLVTMLAEGLNSDERENLRECM